MQHVIAVLMIILMGGWPGVSAASEKGIEELPKDVWDIAAEPARAVTRQVRRFDPISGLWFGLLEGSIKSVERTVDLVVEPEENTSGSSRQSGKPILRYSF